MSKAEDARVALLERLFDHAPLFPPASLPLPDALAEDLRARESPHAFVLGRFVCPASRLGELPGSGREVSAVLDAPLPPGTPVEAVEVPPSESLAGVGPVAREVYVEVVLDDGLEERLDEIAGERMRAKVRCGGASVPDAGQLARFVRSCRERGVAFKATAGLHHAVPTDGEHGFLNLLAAAVFGDEERALSEGDRSAFVVDAEAFRWRDRAAGAREVAAARRDRPPLDRQLQLLRAGRGARGSGSASAVNGAVGFGVFSRGGEPPRVGFRVGNGVLDLAASGLGATFSTPSLSSFLSQGRTAWEHVTARVAELVAAGADLTPLERVTVHLPFDVADYVDFYSSLEHATNLGRLFRPDSDPLLPNWRHLPVGYHGRAGTVVVSGTPVVRPCGQTKGADEAAPVYGPSRRLDFELELGFVVGVGSTLGEPVPGASFRDHVFGVVLVNDWSARDLQAWEYQPLGPFLGKSFATSISAWVTPLALLEDRFVAAPLQQPEPLPYLRVPGDWGLDVELEVELAGNVDLADERARPLLDDPPAARARDGERRGAAHRRPPCLGDDLRSRSRQRGVADRAHLERRAARSGSATAAREPSSRTATSSSCAAGRAASSSER